MAEQQDKPNDAAGSADRNSERQGPPGEDRPAPEQRAPDEVESREPPPEARPGDSGEATPQQN